MDEFKNGEYQNLRGIYTSSNWREDCYLKEEKLSKQARRQQLLSSPRQQCKLLLLGQEE